MDNYKIIIETNNERVVRWTGPLTPEQANCLMCDCYHAEKARGTNPKNTILEKVSPGHDFTTLGETLRAAGY